MCELKVYLLFHLPTVYNKTARNLMGGCEQMAKRALYWRSLESCARSRRLSLGQK